VNKVEVDKELLVRKIKDGTVIDHIPAGNALNVIKILGLPRGRENRMAIIMYTSSSKMMLKDIIKVEGLELTSREVNMIALIAPNATINIIRDYVVVRKERVHIPEYFEGIIKCSNPNCISNQDRETAKPKFKVVSDDPLILRCIYCERHTYKEDILRQFGVGR